MCCSLCGSVEVGEAYGCFDHMCAYPSTYLYPRESYAKRVHFSFCLSRFRGATSAHNDIRKCQRNRKPLIFRYNQLQSSSHVFCYRNWLWKWFEAVDAHQNSCLFLSLIKSQCTQKNLTNTRYKPFTTTEGSFFLSDPPLLCTCPQTRSFSSLFRRRNSTLYCLFEASKRRIHYALFWLILKKMSAILFHLFFFFFYLPYCSYKTYCWVDECIVLLLLTCLRLYGFAVSMFGGRAPGAETLV